MNYCKKCGAKLEDECRFCPKCGNSVLKEENTQYLANEDTSDGFKRDEEVESFNLDEKNTNEENKTFEIDTELDAFNENQEDVQYESKFSNENNDFKDYDSIRETLNNNNKDEIKDSNRFSNNKNWDSKDEYINNDEDEEINDNFKNQEDFKKKNKKKIIILTSVLSVAIIVVLVFLFKDNLLYKVYLDKANGTNVISEKLINYNKALRYDYNENIKDSIYDVVKNEADFLDQVKKLNSLKEEDLNKLVSKIYVYNIKQALDKLDYKSADAYLQEAKSKNYELNKIGNYNELAKAIDDNKNVEKKLKEEEDRVKEEAKKAEKRKEEEMKENERLKQEKLSKQNEELSSINDKLSYNYNYNNYDFIVPDSHNRYMTEKELGFYDKYTLGLIRNEIYARHGYVFSTQPYKSYFESKSWYYKDYNFKGTPLNKYEKANVDLILREEKRR